MSRVSAKRIAVIAAAGLALVSALAVLVLDPRGVLASRTLGAEAFEWAVPLTAGLFVGLSAWALLGEPGSSASTPQPAETECPSCGRTILADWRLCPHCGALVTADPDGSTQYETPARQ